MNRFLPECDRCSDLLSALHDFGCVAQSFSELRILTEHGNYYFQQVPFSKVMLKSLILGSSITFLSALSLPAFATDWRTTGVSKQTRETVAIDMDSIDRSNGKYDVRFRYLIGKDLVQASVNCDSSLVTPDQGKPFVPDMTGATREMIKLACGTNSSSSRTSYDRGYGDGSRMPNDFDFRGFKISQESIAYARRSLNAKGFPLAREIPDFQIAEDLAEYCEVRSMGNSDNSYVILVVDPKLPPVTTNASIRRIFWIQTYYGSISIAARFYACTQYQEG